jgi:hypothetical protein
MCIMEVRPGQHHSTITQALAHNIGTVIGDITMFVAVLERGGNKVDAMRLDNIKRGLEYDFDNLMSIYKSMLSAGVLARMRELDIEGLPKDSIENLVAACVDRDANRARYYETRKEPTLFEVEAKDRRAVFTTDESYLDAYHNGYGVDLSPDDPERQRIERELAPVGFPSTPPFGGVNG